MSILGSSHSQAGFLLQLIHETQDCLTLKFPSRSPWGPLERGSAVQELATQRVRKGPQAAP